MIKIPIDEINKMSSKQIAEYIIETTQTSICKDDKYCKKVLEIFNLKQITMAQEFFKQLAELMVDRQECVINIKKIEGDLVIMVTPDIKKKGTALQMTGNPDEIDLNFIHELKKPVTVKAEFKSESIENPDLDEEDEEKDTKSSGKKDGKKKKAAKPGVDKKKTDKKTTKNLDKGLMRTKEDEKVFSERIEKDRLQREAIDAEKVKKESFDKLMASGKANMEARKYAEAEADFKSAVELFPNDEKAKKELIQATKWVGAMAKL